MPQTDLAPGQVLHGFSVRRVTPLPELNAALTELEHQRTGARYIHMANADDNNLFAVGFHTPPLDSTGAPHILEHTVLCGSRRYPVHDPFFSMLKRSLSTFMNALTADDWTLYPFSSQNRKDFYNLMGVYLDAVFFPLLREADFRQEGHRLEFEDPENPDSPLVIKGVVYNEMKGHMTDPSSLLGTRMAEALYPTTPYGRNAGGEPAHIPDLTWKSLREFHATFYHPSNAYFFSYGDLPLAPHLERVEDLALAGFEALEPRSAVSDEVRFTAPVRVEAGYPIDPGESTSGKTMVQMGWLTCPITDSRRRLAMELLSTLLLGNSAAPLHKALLDSKLGANLAPGAGYGDENRETTFEVGLQGTDPEHADAIEGLVLETLEGVARDGFSRERIDAAMQQMEFHHREVRGDHYPYGLGLLTRIMGPWIHGADPAEPLRLGQGLDALRREIETGPFFQTLIRRELLENPHRVTLTLRPDPAVRERDREREVARIERLESRLGETGRQVLVAQARELQESQEREEDPSVLPTLEISDIPRKERPVEAEEGEGDGVPVTWFDQPTNGIGYFMAHLDIEATGGEHSEILPLFCMALPRVGAAGQPYTVMAERMAAKTGGIHAGLVLLEDPEASGAFRAVAEIHGKALDRHQPSLFEILLDLIRAPDFRDRARLQTVFNQLRINLDNSLSSVGHRYAARAAAAGLTPSGKLKERWAGIEHIRFVREVAALDLEGLGKVCQRLESIAQALLRCQGMACAVASEGKAFPAVSDALGEFLESVPGQEILPGLRPSEGGRFESVSRNLGIAASVPVSYCARVFRCVPYAHPDTAGLLVLAKLLRSGYLHREIREKGGAYGGMAGHSAESGLFSMLSYRDPHIVRTLRVFDQAAEWAAAGRFEDEAVKEAILGVFSDLDTPRSPGGRAALEFGFRRQGLTRAMRQRLRDGVLAVERRDLARLADQYLLQGREGSAVAVMASQEALERANRELGPESLAIEKV